MTNRIDIRMPHAALHVSVFQSMPNIPHQIRFMVCGPGKDFPVEVEIEAHRCTSREDDTWIIDGKIRFSGDPTQFKEQDKVRVCCAYKKGNGEIRKLRVLTSGELASIVHELAHTPPHELPEDYLDISRWRTGDVQQTKVKWVDRNPEFAWHWYEHRRLTREHQI